MTDPRPDSSVHSHPPPPSLSRVLGRALGGGLIMAVALGAGTAVGPVVADAVGVTGFVARLVPAVLVSAVAMPLVVFALRRRRGSLVDIGFGGAGPSLRALLVGTGVTAGAAALVLGAGTAAGMLRWAHPDLPVLAGYIVTNAVIALLLEALPEETTLRGHTWTSLRSRFGGTASALGTTAVFLAVPGLSTMVEAGAARLVGGEAGPVGLVPEGQNPADYLILLTVFGLMLVAARTTVRHAPLWAGIGAHLTFLTVNRVVFEGDRRGAGWSVETTQGAELLVPVYLLVAMAVFLLWRRRAADPVGPGRKVATASGRHGQAVRLPVR
ncbi:MULTISPECIES: CPBP family glutamic-type intramembrane protease [unclassified Streptomyces]|uniref:CPBP family glutamic-type intramembrane protease n=1 Tax=unclassified Streptomyces TaxID=2593676 RepID=UPI00362AE04F